MLLHALRELLLWWHGLLLLVRTLGWWLTGRWQVLLQLLLQHQGVWHAPVYTLLLQLLTRGALVRWPRRGAAPICCHAHCLLRWLLLLSHLLRRRRAIG